VLNLGFHTVHLAEVLLSIAMAIYYLAWKYAVGYFNRIVELR
jgi:hypothetical protein